MSQAAAPVISEAYRKQQQALHENPDYGVASISFAPLVAQVLSRNGARTLSDYGAGKQNLRKALEAQGVEVAYCAYDPAFPEYGAPQPADLVCCIDVLEHIEPEYLENVLSELEHITVKHGFFSVHTGPAGKVLADGRNAHLIQEPIAWWRERLETHFAIEHLVEAPGGFFIIAAPRPR